MQLFKPEYINLLIAGASFRSAFDRMTVEHDYRLGMLAFIIGTALTISAMFMARIREKARLDEQSEKVWRSSPDGRGGFSTRQSYGNGHDDPATTSQFQGTWQAEGAEGEGTAASTWQPGPASDLDTE